MFSLQGWAFRALQIPGVVPFGPPGRVEHLATRVHGRPLGDTKTSDLGDTTDFVEGSAGYCRGYSTNKARRGWISMAA